MNFKGRKQGFYGEDQISSRGKLPAFSHTCCSSSSSPSSSPSHRHHGPHQQQQQQQHHKGYVPLDYQQQPRGWLENKFDSSQEDVSTLRCYGGAVAAGIEFMDCKGGGCGDDENDDEDDNNGGGPGESGINGVMEREHMFDKVVTPSDVGKLNRLVIPKQHAEKYFPLDSSTNEKGLLLNFEDRNGKPWRFRYSYWNSSQSYVMTKGWSRFVKEKKLDAGDIVSFQRGVGEVGKDRLFIDWRRRPHAPQDLPHQSLSLSLPHHHHHHYFSYSSRLPIHPWSPLVLQQQQQHSPQASHVILPAPSPPDYLQFPQQNAATNPPHQLLHYPTTYIPPYGYISSGNSSSAVNPYSSGSTIYLRAATAGAGAGPGPQQHLGMVHMQKDGVEPLVFDSVPVVQGKAAAKRLRLFGVNMECPISEESDECDILSRTTIPNNAAPHLHPHSHLSLSSTTSISPLQSSFYNGTPLPRMPFHMLDKGKASMSLDLDI